VIHITENNNVSYLVGNKNIYIKPLPPFEKIICEYLEDLSKELRLNKTGNEYPDISTFSFWCRKTNILKIRNEFEDGKVRLGLGLVLHITPSNIPTNFAYSFVFGLLSGNANIIRLPSEKFEQIDIICSAIKKTIENKKYHSLKNMNAIIRYGHSNGITSNLSKYANARVIWGGDSTINAIKKYPTPLRSIDLTFADRYSICIINSNEINILDEKRLGVLGSEFYNDTYLMDQNACSSPHLIVWIGKNIEVAMEKFWFSVYKMVKQKYNIKTSNVIDKFSKLCNDSISLEGTKKYKQYGNLIYLIKLQKLPTNIQNLRGKCGYFYEYEITDLNHLAENINHKIQTLTYFGLKKSDLISFVKNNRLSGIDRIVPIGRALDIGFYWDGYNVLNSLSRIIEVE